MLATQISDDTNLANTPRNTPKYVGVTRGNRQYVFCNKNNNGKCER